MKKKITDLEYAEMSNFLSVFGDYSRIKMLYALTKESLTVTDLCSKLGMTKSAISHQLRILKDNRIINGTKSGKNIFYKLDDEHVEKILTVTREHMEEK